MRWNSRIITSCEAIENQRPTIGTKKATILQLMVVAKSMRMPSIERVVERVVEDSCLVVSWGEVIMKIRA